jgi:sugar lactone lactonase YvrE
MPAGYVTAQTGTVPVTGTFQMLPGSPDFTLPATTPSNLAYPSPATCLNITKGQYPTSALAGQTLINGTAITTGYQLDNSLECYVDVTFNPQGPGVRTGILQVKTSSGAIYQFGLTGVGSGPQVVIDGGLQTAFATNATAGLGAPGQITVAQSGTVYIADPANNRIVVEPAGGGAQTTVGTGLSGPKGVAVDAAGNVYIADTGNNRVVKVAAVGGAQTVLGGIAAVGVPAYPAMTFKAPSAVALDPQGNLYVADTGNSRIVEISPFGKFAPAVLLQYPGAPTLTTPVGIAVDSSGNIYVADSSIGTGIVKILPGGGDLQPTVATTNLPPEAYLVGFGSAPNGNPSGVAVDAAGDLYVSDSVLNIVEFISGSTGAAATPYALSFTGMSAPGSVALDSQGNVYVADTGNKQVLLMNRTQVAYNFGQVPLDTRYSTGDGVTQGQPIPPAPLPALQPLTVTNIGNGVLPILKTFGALSGANAGNFAESDSCSLATSGTNFPTLAIGAGLHCLAIVSDVDTTQKGAQSVTLTAQGGAATVNFSAVAIAPLATITLAVSSSGSGGLIAGNTATVTATATQPNITGNVPTGNVTFTYTVDGVAGTPVVVALSGTGTASFNLPTLLLGRKYVVNAAYAGDAANSASDATPLPFYVPGLPVTVSAASITYTYGSAVPAITGTVTGIQAADASSVSYTFTSLATASSNVTSATNPPYPITVVFAPTAGASNPTAYLNYGFPTVYTTPGGSTPATVTENQYPLTFTIQPWTLSYGAPADDPVKQVTGSNGNSTQNIWEYIQTPTVNGDNPKPTFTPGNTTVLPVGTYTVSASLSIPVGGSTYDRINNYALTVVPGKLTVVKEATITATASAATAEQPTAAAVAAATQTVGSAPAGTLYYGTPTGTVTITDYFTPIIAASPGVGTPTTTVYGPFPYTKGAYVYTETSLNLGTHAYYTSYSGDSNFLPSYGLPSLTQSCLNLESPALLGAGQQPSSCLLVDYADFNVTASGSPMQVLPGVVPGGIAAINNQNAAYPQYEAVLVNSIQGYVTYTSSGTPAVNTLTNLVNVTCATSAPTWLSCGLSLTYSATYGLSNPVSPVTIGNPTIHNLGLLSGKSATMYLQVSAPATLPVNFFSTEVRGSATKAVLAYLPLAALVFLPLAWKSRRRLSKALFLLIALAAISVGTSACQHNSVEFYTPVPLGPQTVTVTAVGPGTAQGGTALPCKNPTASPNDCVNRAFVVPISVQ